MQQRVIDQFLSHPTGQSGSKKFQKLKSLIFVIILAKNEAGNFTPVNWKLLLIAYEKKNASRLDVEPPWIIPALSCVASVELSQLWYLMTLHMDTKTMNCHYCGYSKAIPRHCPNCQSLPFTLLQDRNTKTYDELQRSFLRLKFCVWMWILPKKGATQQY